MDLHAAMNDFFVQSRDLLNRMKSSEGQILTEVELHILRAQLRLLDVLANGMQQEIAARQRTSSSKIDPCEK
jgi:hypothetical protein